MVQTISALIILLSLFFGICSADSIPVKIVQIEENDFSLLRESEVRGLDILTRIPGRGIVIAIRENNLIELECRGVFPEVLCHDFEAAQNANAWAYHSWNEAISYIENIADNYPSITMLEIIGQSVNGREIQALKISDNPLVEEEDEVDVLFVGLHHAREWPSLEMGLYVANILTSNYASDPAIRNLVNTREIYVVPCLNPDGYVYCHDQGRDWRKNRRYFPEFGTYGVDLNRNWGGSCDAAKEGQWGSIYGSVSHGSESEVYCGPGPFSENETAALREFVLDHKFHISISYHTYGELILYPWGYTYSSCPDQAVQSSYASQMASRMSRQYGGTYTPIQSSGLYPTTGDMTDWSYGHSLFSAGHNSIAFTVEMCASFQPPSSQLQSILVENWDGAVYMLEEATNIYNSLTYRVMPPVIDPIGSVPGGDFQLTWEVPNPDSDPSKYKLEELSGLEWIPDGGEAATGDWILSGGFTRTTSRKHSGSYSYYSNLNSNNKVTTMRLAYPWPVSSGDAFEFWMYTDIELNWDYGFLEVSLDGNSWDLLDSYTGSSSWTKKTYSLDEYAGSSVYIQFRYITDDYVLEPGLYVDDITLIPSFASVQTLSSNILDTHYDVTGKNPGTYHYRVTGYNNSRGWGDPGILEDVIVTGDLNVEVEIIPDSFIVYQGGDFSYSLRVSNLDSDPLFIDAWTDLYLPGGDPHPGNPFVGPLSGSIPGYGEVVRDFSHPVPYGPPLGIYEYIFSVGDYPGVTYAQHSVEIELQ